MADQPQSEVTRPPFYWCLSHARVESAAGCPNDMRMGPYDSREQAETAIDRARERTQAWDEEEEDRWRHGGDGR